MVVCRERMGRMDACSNEVAGGAGGEVHHRLRAARMRKWKRSRVCHFGKGMWTSVNFLRSHVARGRLRVAAGPRPELAKSKGCA